MQIATYTSADKLTRIIEQWCDLTAARAYYFNLLSVDGRAPAESTETRVKSPLFPERQVHWIDGGVNGKIGLAKAVQS